jgi:Uma2 family endonuclease
LFSGQAGYRATEKGRCDMAVQVLQEKITRYKFNVEQYERMIEIGILGEDERVELIDGEIVAMSLVDHAHATCIAILELLLRDVVGRRAYLWSQNPILLDEHTRPQPDIALLRWRDDRYMSGLPVPGDIILLIEVADTSLASDRAGKVARYAQAGVPETWLVNLTENVIEVYSEPVGRTYASVRTLTRGDTLAVPGGFEGSIKVDEVLGKASSK